MITPHMAAKDQVQLDKRTRETLEIAFKLLVNSKLNMEYKPTNGITNNVKSGNS